MGFLLIGEIRQVSSYLSKGKKPCRNSSINIFDTPYLLPVIRNNGVDEWHQYQNAAHRINRNLKQIGKQIGLDILLYLCRAPCMGQYCPK